MERIAKNALRAMKLASLTGFAPAISCMRGRHVSGLHHRDENGEGQKESHRDEPRGRSKRNK